MAGAFGNDGNLDYFVQCISSSISFPALVNQGPFEGYVLSESSPYGAYVVHANDYWTLRVHSICCSGVEGDFSQSIDLPFVVFGGLFILRAFLEPAYGENPGQGFVLDVGFSGGIYGIYVVMVLLVKESFLLVFRCALSEGDIFCSFY